MKLLVTPRIWQIAPNVILMCAQHDRCDNAHEANMPKVKAKKTKTKAKTKPARSKTTVKKTAKPKRRAK